MDWLSLRVRKFDSIQTVKEIGFITGQRSTGYFALGALDGTRLTNSGPTTSISKQTVRIDRTNNHLNSKQEQRFIPAQQEPGLHAEDTMKKDQDMEIICDVCQEIFIFNIGEQNFYSQKGLKFPPKSCKQCRKTPQGKKLVCEDCQCSFLFTSAEEKALQKKGLIHQPKRCHHCRNLRRTRLLELTRKTTVKIGPTRTEVTVLCHNCHKKTTVPFLPIKDLPVYCRACFLVSRMPDPALLCEA